MVSLLLLGCQSDTDQASLPDSSTNQAKTARTSIVKLDVGPAGLSMEPLESASRGDAEILFESLSSDSTGIDFVNPIDQSHPQKYLFASAVACGGVAVGDIDNDGWPDMFFTSGPNKNRLYRQIGPMKFEDVTASAKLDSGDAWSAGAAMVDIDNDGDQELLSRNRPSVIRILNRRNTP